MSISEFRQLSNRSTQVSDLTWFRTNRDEVQYRCIHRGANMGLSLDELARNAERSFPCLTRHHLAFGMSVRDRDDLTVNVGPVMLLISPPSPWYPRVDHLLRRLLFGTTHLHRLNLV